jgi:hypothetical protein
MIDIQLQQENEPDKAYKAFLTFRDQGVGRTVQASYVQYIMELDQTGRKQSDKIGSASPGFRKWVTDYFWDDRVKDWDAGHAKRLQAKLLEADQEKYINSVENLRSEVESVAKGLMQISKLSSVISAARLAGMATELGLGKKSNIISHAISRELLHEHDKLTATAGNAAKILVTASEKLSEALGLERIITELNNAKDSE